MMNKQTRIDQIVSMAIDDITQGQQITEYEFESAIYESDLPGLLLCHLARAGVDTALEFTGEFAYDDDILDMIERNRAALAEYHRHLMTLQSHRQRELAL